MATTFEQMFPPPAECAGDNEMLVCNLTEALDPIVPYASLAIVLLLMLLVVLKAGGRKPPRANEKRSADDATQRPSVDDFVRAASGVSWTDVLFGLIGLGLLFIVVGGAAILFVGDWLELASRAFDGRGTLIIMVAVFLVLPAALARWVRRSSEPDQSTTGDASNRS